MTQSWGHTKFGSHEVKLVAKTVDAIIEARGLTDKATLEELGWKESAALWALRRGQKLSVKKVNDLRIWIRRWMHVLSTEKKVSA